MSNRFSQDSTRRSNRSRALPKRKPSFRPTLEGLETRLVLSTITWSGKGDGTTFSSGANWNGNVAPGSGDDAQIAISGFNNIQLPAGGDTLHSLSVTTTDTIILSSGTLTTTTGVSLSGGATLDFAGGSIAGTVPTSLTNAALNYQGSSVGSSQFLMLSANTVTGTIASNQTITVQGNNSTSNSTLNLAAGSSNAGMILLESANGSNDTSNLSVASGTTFINTGTIEVGPSNNASALNGGNFDNQGTLIVEAGAYLNVGTAGSIFTQDTGGTLTGNGAFVCNAGTFLVNGGTLTGNVNAQGCSLDMAATIAVPTTVYVVGSVSTTLLANASTFGTVWVEGNNGNGNETLILPSGSVNDGTILLQSANGSNDTSNLSVASGTTFINTGTVQVNTSNNASSLTGGNFDNKGTLIVEAGAYLNVGTAGSIFTQDIGGTLTGNGAFVCNAGTFLVNGGTLTGNVNAQGCSLDMAATIAVPTTVYVVGSASTTLLANASTFGTVWVEGTNGDGNETLILPSGTVNAGTILLQSANGSNDTSNLSVASGTTFTNTGTVQVGPSNNASSLTGGNFDNKGTLIVEAAATLVVGTAGSIFTQDTTGTLTATGTFFCTAGTLLVNGGTVSSGGVVADGCSLDMAATIVVPTTVYAFGSASTTLVANASTFGTVWVEGNNNNGNETLILPAGSVNDGTILLQSANGSNDTSNLSVASGTTFVNTGTIEVGASNNGSSLTGGNFDNKGILTISAAAGLVVGTAGDTFTQDTGGTLTATGYFVCNAGTLLVNGGTVSGGVDAEGCSLDMAATIAVPTTVYALGSVSTTLLANASTFGTVWVEGNNGNGNETLTLPSGSVNDGTILLESANGSNDTSNLSVASGTTFVNTGTIEVNASNNGSSLTGNFDNKGILTISAAAGLVVGTAGDTFTQDTGGTLTATGYFVCNAGTLLVNGGTVSGGVDAEGCSLDMAATIAVPTTVYALGSVSTTLLANASTFGTVWVEGNNGNGNETLILPSGSVNAGTILLQSANGSNDTSNLSVVSGSTFVNTGTVQVNSSNAASVLTGNFTNSGTLNIAGASLTLAGSGTELINSTTGLINAWGTLNDSATTFINNGTLSIDTGAPASLAITGTYTQTSTGSLSIELGGTTAGSTFDQLAVSGSASLAGTLGVSTINSFLVSKGNSFKVLTFASGSGAFTTYNGLDLANGLILLPSQTATALTLTTLYPTTINSTAGTPQSAVVGVAFATPLQASVYDQNGNPLAGVVVTFAAPASGASGSFAGGLTSVTETTNALGVATAPAFTAGTTYGPYTVTASASGIATPASYSLTNTIAGASTISATAGTPQSATVGTAFATALQATVDDRYGNPIVGAVVTFAAPTSGVGGSFTGGKTSVTSTTNSLGVATAPAFTALLTVGSYVVTASVSGVSTAASYILTNTVGAATGISASAGSLQNTLVDTPFATVFQAVVDDQYGNPVSGIVVTFAAPASGATGNFSGPRTVAAITNSAGVAIAPAFIAGATVGSYTVTASVSGITTPASYSLTNTPAGATSVSASAGTPQSAIVGVAFATPLQVTVDDQYGNPIAGVVVSFVAPSSGVGGDFTGNKTSVTATTNSSGVAIAPAFTANSTVGSYTVTASVSGVSSSASFILTNTVGSVTSITATAGTLQNAIVGTPFTTAFQAIVDDQYGNPVSGIVVTFAAPTSGAGGNFSGSRTITATTNLAGVATAPVFTAGTTSGTYVVTSSVLGVATSASYNLTNIVGSVTSVLATAGTPQSAAINTAFSTLQATVEDPYGNPIAGVIVTFAAPGNGASGSFAGGLTSVTEITNTSGIATAPAFTADAMTGPFTVTASVASVATPALYSLMNVNGIASSITASSGSSQSAVVGAAFSTALQATVDDQNGDPLAGVVVTFAAPASGTSGNFSGSRTTTAVTNSAGVATAPSFTAGTTVGSYTVTASVTNLVATASYSLMNTVGTATSITTTAGSSQSATVGVTFATLLKTTVDDQYGNPVAGIVVTFAAPASGAGGNFSGSQTTTAITNSAGVATAPSFTAGTIAGSYSVIATVSGVTSSASFNLSNTAGAASIVLSTAGTPQSAIVGSAFSTALQATVEDQYGNPISGESVTFTAPTSGASGTFAAGTTVTETTNSLGLATAPAFAANRIANSYSVIATVSGISATATFSLTNTPGVASTIVATAGTPQSTGVGTAYATALQAKVTDQFGNPISGAIVTFTAPTSGASGTFAGGLTSVAETTNAAGVATASTFTANTIYGSYSVIATVSGVTSSASFSLTNRTGTGSITATAGTPQSAIVGSAFTTALQATVEDQYGNPISGVIVTFAAPTSGASGTFAAGTTVTVTTNSLGVAMAPAFAANRIANSYSVIATVSGISATATFSLTNTTGSTSTIVATAGTPQSTVVGNAYATAFQTKVTDVFGNPISGAIVTFAAPTSGASGGFAGVTMATATTNSLGVATAPSFTANTKAGSYSVTAMVSGVSTAATFSLSNTPGSASGITTTAGNSQSAIASTVFSTALQATVEDQYGNPISGVSVTFAAPASGPSGNFAGAKSKTVTTNSLGVATAPAYTAGILVGSYSVIATASGVSSSASFSLTNTEMTSTTLNVSTSLVPIDVAETLTATVAPVAPGLTTPTGSVSFYDGSKLLGSATINSSGQAMLTISTLAYGAHSITATYTGIPAESTSASKSVPIQVGDTVSGDYDGDGKTDIAIFDQTTATFSIQYSGGGNHTQQLGNPADKLIPVAGDFDGSGKDDIAIYDQTLAEFFILYSNGTGLALPFGNPAHVNIPVAGDYDGTGKTDIAIFDQTASIFYILYSNGTSLVESYGNPAHVNIPVAGDFDGGGKTNIAIYDQTAATFYVQESLGKTVIQPLGNASHVNVPIAADYDGDGKTDFAVYDQTGGIFYALESTGETIAQLFGNPADVVIPLASDFTGDGKTDITIYDATAGEYFIVYSDGGTLALLFGNSKHKNLPI